MKEFRLEAEQIIAKTKTWLLQRHLEVNECHFMCVSLRDFAAPTLSVEKNDKKTGQGSRQLCCIFRCLDHYICVFLYICQQCEVIPSELSVMSVTFWPFCALPEWPPLETESLASEPLSCSSWLSSGPGTFTRIVFCRLLVTVLKRNTNLQSVTYTQITAVATINESSIAWTDTGRSRCVGRALYISDFSPYQSYKYECEPLTCWAGSPEGCLLG